MLQTFAGPLQRTRRRRKMMSDAPVVLGIIVIKRSEPELPA
jgi:hypothetical protein